VLCIVILGMANILPWLAFISCADYFSVIFPTANTSFVFPLLYMTLMALGTIFTTVFGRYVRERARASERAKRSRSRRGAEFMQCGRRRGLVARRRRLANAFLAAINGEGPTPGRSSPRSR
jgi:hypothetical protein